MLSAKDNEALTRVGRGTPMGELMRRYWQPIAAVAQLDERPTLPVRLLGEDLVLYRDGSGGYGLLDRHCPHRRADLSYGMVEACGLRCHYHGWHFDGTGRCLEQPFEDAAHPDGRFRDKIRITAYPIEAKAGLLWAYLGPAPAPLVPDWDLFGDQGYKQIVFSEVPCNWFQGQENSIDPVHFEWLHSNWTAAQRGERARAPRHLKIAFDEFEWGFVYRRVREDSTEQDDLWTVGRVSLWPNCLYTGKFEWRVPIDDEHTLHVAWFNDPLPGTSSVRAGAHSVLVRAGHRSGHRALPHQPRDEPGLRGLAGAGNHRRSHAGASGRERSRRHPVSQAHARGSCDRRAGRRAQGGRA